MGAPSTTSERRGHGRNHRDDETVLSRVQLPLEIRVHGRGGQGGVTCAKLIALMYSSLGLFAQTFGDYGMERAGAPVRAYTRVDRSPIRNRNKVYTPDHVLILDSSLLGEGVLEGVCPGSLVLLNTAEEPSTFHEKYGGFRFCTVNATEIALRHGIGSSSVIIVNTSIVGAYARLIDLPREVIEETYSALGLENDLRAAAEAYDSVFVTEMRAGAAGVTLSPQVSKPSSQVIAVPDLTFDMPTPLKTGSWRTQSPVHRERHAPCHMACPAGNDIAGFIQALKQDGIEAAAEVLLRTQPLPSVCGRVCPAPCTASCNRSGYDGAVNIRGLERWIGDHATGSLIERRACTDPRKVAIVGGGPAGLSAGFALLRAGHDVTIYDCQPRLGGILRSAIPAYRLPDEALDRDIGRMLALGLRVECGESVDATRVRALARGYDAVIIATGQARLRPLDVAGAQRTGVEQGLDFLNRVKIGAPEQINGTVVVLGGGNTAIDCARTALRCGASKVSLVYRRGREEMPAIEPEVEEAIAEGVEILLCRQPVRFLGDGRVTGVELAEVELGDSDSRGRRRPLPTTRSSVMDCDHVLLAVGQYSDLGLLPSEWTVRDGRAYHSDQATNVWLAGDLTTEAGTVAHAVGHGRAVARDVLLSLGDPDEAEARDSEGTAEVVSLANIRLSHFPRTEVCQDRHAPLSSRSAGFQEVNLGQADDIEAQRCFSCGHCTQCDTCLIYCPEGIISRETRGYAISGEYCKGCGICVWECPRNAMQMTDQGYRS
jgi:2-oxoacid:acceptor oxidoreductase gamma subunit (pyruvate/2-ketoisovalerate family)